MMKKVAGWMLYLGGLVALGVLWVGIQGSAPCPESIYTGVEAYLLHAREIRVEGTKQALSSHQISLTTPSRWNKTHTDAELHIIIRDADGELLAIGGGRL